MSDEITIELTSMDGSTLEDLLGDLKLTEASFSAPADDGFENVFTDTMASLVGTSATAMKNVLAKLRDFASTDKARQITVTIDGERIALGDLTDAQVESLLPA
ncbi:MAG: hypothetical protein AAF548_05195 [Actinomycetota bacterium]